MRRIALYSRGLIVSLSVLCGVTAAGQRADAQILVYPRRPSKTDVRYSNFHWHYIDIRRGKNASGKTIWTVGSGRHGKPWQLPTDVPTWIQQRGPSVRPLQDRAASLQRLRSIAQTASPTRPQRLPPAPAGKGDKKAATPSQSGGVRLYFYERERPSAEEAAASIAKEYDYLVRQFHYVPKLTVPYFLYNAYKEFLQTHLFAVQEGVLGVTSPVNLHVALPFLGDHRLFQHVSTHELTHEFMIQKLRSYAGRIKGGGGGDPLGRFPLWFTEGIAEYYSLHGIDPEDAMMVRDLVIHPNLHKHYMLPGFFQSMPPSFLWTYKMGQMRCAFLEKVYGPGTLQQIIEESPRMLASGRGQESGFAALVAKVTGDSPKKISERFKRWVKSRAYRSFLRAGLDVDGLDRVPADARGVQQLSSSRDGKLFMYRGFDGVTGETALYVADYRDPRRAVLVAKDGEPGMESLHPVGRRTFSVTEKSLAFVLRTANHDTIIWQPLHVQPPKWGFVTGHSGRRHRARVRHATITLGHRRTFDLSRWGILSVDSISIAPNGRSIAFIGLYRNGHRDIFRLEPTSHHRFAVYRLTNDVYSERGLSWGAQGIVYTSSDTADHRFNLFVVNPATGVAKRLTTEDHDEMDPAVFPDGSVYFVEYDRMGANLYQLKDGQLIRRSDVATGLFSVTPAPKGDAWALYYYQGERRIVRVRKSKMTTEKVAMDPSNDPVIPPPQLSLKTAENYDPFSPHNWHFGTVFGLFGASSQGIFGQGVVTASDRLQNHSLILTLVMLGSIDLTDGTLFYTDAKNRTIWGTGIFQDISFRDDQTFRDRGVQFFSGDRFFGVTGIVRYPLDEFRYIQAGLAFGGAGQFLTSNERLYLEDGSANGTGKDLSGQWDALNPGKIMFRGRGTVSLGYNSLIYSRSMGAFSGSSALLQGTVSVQPQSSAAFGTMRGDGEKFFPIHGVTNILLRGGAGYSFGGRLAQGFYLSSFDTLRGIPFGDQDLLLGRAYLFSTAELRLPLSPIIRIPIFDLVGVAGVDFGGVGQDPVDLWHQRILDGVLGVNFGFGPLVLRLQFAKPVDIGGALPNNGKWVTNFSLAYRYR